MANNKGSQAPPHGLLLLLLLCVVLQQDPTTSACLACCLARVWAARLATEVLQAAAAARIVPASAHRTAAACWTAHHSGIPTTKIKRHAAGTSGASLQLMQQSNRWVTRGRGSGWFRLPTTIAPDRRIHS